VTDKKSEIEGEMGVIESGKRKERERERV